MSVESLAAVLHHSRAKGTAKLVLVGIANHDGDGGAWPSVATLARYANVDPRNVQRSLDKLVELGELAVHLQQGGDQRTPDHERPNRYDVLVGCPPWCDRTTQHRDTRATRQPNLRGLTVARPPRQGGGASVTHPPAPASPTPVAGASPKPPTQPDPTPVDTQPQHACAVCAAPSRRVCEERQVKLHITDQHDYSAVARASR